MPPRKTDITVLDTRISDQLLRLGYKSDSSLLRSWLVIKNRTHFYVGIPGYEKFVAWHHNNKKLTNRMRSLSNALTACLSFKEYQKEHPGEIHPEVAKHIESKLKALAKLELLKFERLQLKQLDKIQHLLKEKIAAIEKLIKDKDEALAREENGALVKIFAKIPEAKTDPYLSNVYKQLNKFANKIALRKHTKKAQIALEVAKTANSLRAIVTVAIKAPSAMTMSILGAEATYFGMIPISIGMAMIGVGAGIAVVGSIKTNIVPWVKSRLRMRATRKELATIENSLNELERMVTLKNKDANTPLNLDRRGALILLAALENSTSSSRAVRVPTTTEVAELKEFLINKAKDLSKKNMPAAGYVSPVTLERFKKQFGRDPIDVLRDGYNLQKMELSERFEKHAKVEKRNRVLAVNGLVALAGVGIMLIPTPLTMIIGMSILLASSLVTIGVNRRWDESIRKIFKKLFKHDDLTPGEQTIGPRPNPLNALYKHYADNLTNKNIVSANSPTKEKSDTKKNAKAILQSFLVKQIINPQNNKDQSPIEIKRIIGPKNKP